MNQTATVGDLMILLSKHDPALPAFKAFANSKYYEPIHLTDNCTYRVGQELPDTASPENDVLKYIDASEGTPGSFDAVVL